MAALRLPSIVPCTFCDGAGWVLDTRAEWVCCGNVLDSGECCSAIHGEANLVAEPVQFQAPCPACGGAGEIQQP